MNKMNIYNDYLHLFTKYSVFTPKCGLYTPDHNCAVGHKPVFKSTSLPSCMLRFKSFSIHRVRKYLTVEV